MSGLKACPFCGGENIQIICDFHPRCEKCGAIQKFVAGTNPTEVWNIRATDSKIAELEKQVLELSKQKSHLIKTVKAAYNEGYQDALEEGI